MTIKDYFRRYMLDREGNFIPCMLSVKMSYKIKEPSGVEFLTESQNYTMRAIPFQNARELDMMLDKYSSLQTAIVLSVNTSFGDTPDHDAPGYTPIVIIRAMIEIDCTKQGSNNREEPWYNAGFNSIFT